MSLQAYKTAATRAETPREMEYRLFGQVTRALMHAATLDPSDIAARIDALDWNRRLWTALATDCADPDNAMAPAYTRRTKPRAMVKISSTGWCLSSKV